MDFVLGVLIAVWLVSAGLTFEYCTAIRTPTKADYLSWSVFFGSSLGIAFMVLLWALSKTQG